MSQFEDNYMHATLFWYVKLLLKRSYPSRPLYLHLYKLMNIRQYVGSVKAIFQLNHLQCHR